MGSTTERVRQELAALPLDGPAVPAELAALLRTAGRLARDRQGVRLELHTTTGATARRAHHLLRSLDAVPTLVVREATNVEQRTYGTVLGAPAAAAVGRLLGLLDDGGRPRATAPAAHEAQPAAMVRGAMLGGGSVSGPRRPPHLELRTNHRATAEQLAAAVEALVGTRPSVGATRTGHRAVLKSGVALADLLGAVGATSAYIAQEEQLVRREVRAEAQRLANADAANVRRAVAAASDQVRLVEHAVGVLGWDALGEGLRDVALARLANPSASLTELGQLCDPPVGKSAVHRRLTRLQQLVEEAGSEA